MFFVRLFIKTFLILSLQLYSAHSVAEGLSCFQRMLLYELLVSSNKSILGYKSVQGKPRTEPHPMVELMKGTSSVEVLIDTRIEEVRTSTNQNESLIVKAETWINPFEKLLFEHAIDYSITHEMRKKYGHENLPKELIELAEKIDIQIPISRVFMSTVYRFSPKFKGKPIYPLNQRPQSFLEYESFVVNREVPERLNGLSLEEIQYELISKLQIDIYKWAEKNALDYLNTEPSVELIDKSFEEFTTFETHATVKVTDGSYIGKDEKDAKLPAFRILEEYNVETDSQVIFEFLRKGEFKGAKNFLDTQSNFSLEVIRFFKKLISKFEDKGERIGVFEIGRYSAMTGENGNEGRPIKNRAHKMNDLLLVNQVISQHREDLFLGFVVTEFNKNYAEKHFGMRAIEEFTITDSSGRVIAAGWIMVSQGHETQSAIENSLLRN